MTRPPRPLVVVVSGTSGAGKSSLVAALADALGASGSPTATLHLDDFLRDVGLGPGDVGAWLARGADAREVRTRAMEQALEALLHGSEHESGRPAVVLVEEPFGRARPPFDVEADLALHLRLAPQVALARRLLRDFLPSEGGLDEIGVARVRRHLSRFVDQGDALHEAVQAAAVAGADIVLDAGRDPDELTAVALAAIVDRLPEHRRRTGTVPDPDATGRWHRRSARVLPQDPTGAVLLVLCANPDQSSEPFWISVGGGVEDGETSRQAVVRELWEETGITVEESSVAGPVHAETVVFRWGPAQVVQRQEYFSVRVSDRSTTTTHLDGPEADSVLEHRWWSPADVATTDEVVLPGIRLAVAALRPP